MGDEKLNFVEVFAGAGGLSEGFMQTGFEPIAFVEKDMHACETLKTRMIFYSLKSKGKRKIYHDYLLKKIDKEKLYSSTNSLNLDKVLHEEINDKNICYIYKKIKSFLGKRKLDLMLGGPPCQAYSIIGRVNNSKKKEDERLYLYKYYVELLNKLTPKIFLFENVLGLLSIDDGNLFKEVKKSFNNSGYHVYQSVLDASDFGVLQKRKRLFIIGIRKDSNIKNFDFTNLKKIEHKFLVKHLFEDLPRIPSNFNANTYEGTPSRYVSEHNIRNEQDVLTCHESRKHNINDLEIYQYAVSVWNNGKTRLRYNELPKHLQTHKNTTSFYDRFKVVAGDIEYSHTIMAHIAKDGHYYIHPDNTQNRSLTVREAARIQSFPDNFFFEGPRTSQFVQVGNAVPPLLSKQLAKSIKELL